VGAEDGDREVEFVSDQGDRLDEVGVVGDDDGLVVVAAEAVGEEVGGDVDVGPLLLPDLDADQPDVGDRGMDEAAGLGGLQELSLVDDDGSAAS
jgi:hypothetical protein